MDGHGIIYTLIIGFIAGLLARAIYPGKQKLGIILTIVLGIVGSWVANFIGSTLGWYHSDDVAGLIGSVVGAIIVLSVYIFVQKQMKKS
jgi:uncharacterized membrane protein YeaQ/YmgE (transglycosylase-associated protein family)